MCIAWNEEIPMKKILCTVGISLCAFFRLRIIKKKEKYRENKANVRTELGIKK